VEPTDRAGKKTFVEVGLALAEIRDLRLYPDFRYWGEVLTIFGGIDLRVSQEIGGFLLQTAFGADLPPSQ